MKHIVKIFSLVVAITALWIGLLQSSVIPRSHTWLGHMQAVLHWYGKIAKVSVSGSLLPVYFVVSLGCYGLLMVGVGLMNFPTCPQEALLLQKDIVEAKEYLKQRGVDVSSS
ncbi:Dolichol-phosphate mannosyltransferase-like protein [Arachis hypogaea]|uniref:Dolichol-phosphate mannosyltransferase subunit 3 n=1 Tax=Arachis hypogaea TaxID=3818 RepID=A0A444Y0M5_ARAHY|nr:Dolichol-phosphate mannosyltransferase-like protein [Arachis hypogaea]RYQ95488.1 hypothetical protein Ahy_B08g090801 isoform B [Arachis hypogaea]